MTEKRFSRDDTAWRVTPAAWSGGEWGTEHLARRAITDKGERFRQRAILTYEGLRRPPHFSTNSQGDPRERLPWLALATVIMNPDVDVRKVHQLLNDELNADNRSRRLRRYTRDRRAS